MMQPWSALILAILPAVQPHPGPAERPGTESTAALGAPPNESPPKPPPPGTGPSGPRPTPAPALRCTLRTPEAPRGGRLEVEGDAFGKTPVLRIGGRIARILERSELRIAVQIPRDSDGGAVTVTARGAEAECGTLTIIGRN
jgi:hypothetical protein